MSEIEYEHEYNENKRRTENQKIEKVIYKINVHADFSLLSSNLITTLTE
jgi:ABC-type sulfate transport system substrate-binding protein